MKTILVPVDFSRLTDRVLAEATGLAHTLDARLVVLHVTEPAVGTVDYAVVSVTIAQANDTAVENALARLAVLAAQLQTCNVSVETRHCVGIPVEEILSQAAAISADYIVMGSHGHGRIYDALVGSTTQGLLKRALCPVLIVPAKMPQKAPVEETEITI